MCTGHQADQIENEFGNGDAWDVLIEYSKEKSPLGTAGAIRLAAPHLQNVADFFVVNGDSIVDADLDQLYQFHRRRGGIATITVVREQNAARYGTVDVDETGKIRQFIEKGGANVPGVINAGLYVFSSNVLNLIPTGAVSLEKTVFPALLDRGVFAFEQNGFFIDIGTPEDYARAQTLSERLNAV
jgi:NDP-sugar pyrophosphorylase family protein